MSNTSEKILVLGLGGVGYYLAQRLAHEGHQLTIIESRADVLRKADAEMDARFVRGDVLSFRSWREARAEGADLLIAVTDSDAVNIVATQIADRLGIGRKVARVRSLGVWEPDAIVTSDDLGIDLVIRPGELAAQEICRMLKMRAGNTVVDVCNGALQVVATHVTRASPLCRMVIRDFAENHDDLDFRVVCVARVIDTIIPGGDFKILPDDHVYILAPARDMPRVMELVGVKEERRRKVLIIGGGRIGQRVAELLEDAFPVTLLERDPARAEELSHRLRRVEVLQGDGSDGDTLIQAGLLHMDTMIAAAGDNETNIMSSVLAKHLLHHRSDDPHAEHAKTIALVKRADYLVLASSMGADLAVNKKVLAANQILRYIRRGQVLSVAHLHGCDAEVVELVAEEGSPVTRKPLHKLGAAVDEICIGAVYRDGDWSVAVGATQIAAGERVVGICDSRHLRELQRLFLS